MFGVVAVTIDAQSVAPKTLNLTKVRMSFIQGKPATVELVDVFNSGPYRAKGRTL